MRSVPPSRVGKSHPSSKRHRQNTGNTGETIACWWLRLQGYRILARNWHPQWRRRPGEIDIIAQRWDTIAFVEVKTRHSSTPDMDQQPISHRQQQRIQRTAQIFIANHPRLANCILRFDLIFLTPWAWPRHWRNIWPG